MRCARLAVRDLDQWNLTSPQIPTVWLRHLEARWKIHPELQYLQRTADALECVRRQASMYQAGACRRPLNAAGADCGLLPARVAMRQLALEEEGHSVKTATVMVTKRKAAIVRRTDLRRAEIQEKKRVNLRNAAPAAADA